MPDERRDVTAAAAASSMSRYCGTVWKSQRIPACSASSDMPSTLREVAHHALAVAGGRGAMVKPQSRHLVCRLQLTFFPQFILGYLGMPRRYHTYPPEFQVLNVLSTAALQYSRWVIFCDDLPDLVHALRQSRRQEPVASHRPRVDDGFAATDGKFSCHTGSYLGALRLFEPAGSWLGGNAIARSGSWR